MQILQSQSSFELVVVLTEAEALLYREVFRNQMPVAIPELNDKKFVIKEISLYDGEDAPENSWHLVIKQQAAEQTTYPTTFGTADDQPVEESTGDTHH